MAERALTEKRAKLEARVAGRQNHFDNINGVVLTLGQGDTGQLGLGPDIMERSKPALVKDLSRVKAVCAGGMHTVCLTKEGKVYTFGKLSIPIIDCKIHTFGFCTRCIWRFRCFSHFQN